MRSRGRDLRAPRLSAAGLGLQRCSPSGFVCNFFFSSSSCAGTGKKAAEVHASCNSFFLPAMRVPLGWEREEDPVLQLLSPYTQP